MSARQRAAALDRVQADHLPECPHCHDLNAAGTGDCQGCGAGLVAQRYRKSLRWYLSNSPCRPQSPRGRR